MKKKLIIWKINDNNQKLKEEIDKENYSFLQKNENDLLDNKMVMKAA